MDTISHWISQYGYAGLFVLLMLGIVGVPVPDETLMTFVGFEVQKGNMHPGAALATAVVGSSCGITLSYLLGYFLGLWLIRRHGHWVHLTPERVERVHGWFEKYGKWTLTFGYFIPGFRHVTAYAAGMACMRYWMFAVFAYAGAVIWATSFLVVGYLLGPEWQKAIDYARRGRWVLVGLAALFVAVAVVVWSVRKTRARGPDR
jgi:membrane protein DedA with SNARE-associated domain